MSDAGTLSGSVRLGIVGASLQWLKRHSERNPKRIGELDQVARSLRRER
jgi:hypothetical protein